MLQAPPNPDEVVLNEVQLATNPQVIDQQGQQPQQWQQGQQATPDINALTAQVAELARANAILAQENAISRANAQGAAATSSAPAASKRKSAMEILEISPADTELTKDEAVAYEQSVGVIGKVAKSVAAKYLDKFSAHMPDPGEVAELKQELASLKQALSSQTTNNDAIFINQLNTAVGDLDNLIKDPKWSEYVNSPSPLTPSIKIGDLLRMAVNSKNVVDAAAIYNNFAASKNNVVRQQPVTPGSASQYQTKNATSKGPVYSASAVARADADLRSGRITQDQWEQIMDTLITADLEGRLLQA